MTKHEQLCKAAYRLVERERAERLKRIAAGGPPEGYAHGILEELADEYRAARQPEVTR